MPDEFDSYAPGSNLKEDFDGTIIKASFDKGDNNNANFSFHPVIAADDGDEVESFYGLGSDWESYDGGSSVEHPKGSQRKFNGQTAYSEWNVFAAFGFDGDREDVNARPNRPPRTDEERQACTGAYARLREVDREFEGRGAQHAQPWVGMRFHFDVLKRPGRERRVVKAPDGSALIGPDGKEVVEWKDVERERMLPVRFLGMAQDAVAQSHGGPGTSLGTVTTVPEHTPSAEPATPAATPAVSEEATPPQNTATTGTSTPVNTGGGASNHPSLRDLPMKDRLVVIQKARELDADSFVDAVIGLTTSDSRNMLDVGSVMDGLGDAQAMWEALRK